MRTINLRARLLADEADALIAHVVAQRASSKTPAYPVAVAAARQTGR
jgi:hypothetical protein